LLRDVRDTALGDIIRRDHRGTFLSTWNPLKRGWRNLQQHPKHYYERSDALSLVPGTVFREIRDTAPRTPLREIRDNYPSTWNIVKRDQELCTWYTVMIKRNHGNFPQNTVNRDKGYFP
jgi:hypothetical protein